MGVLLSSVHQVFADSLQPFIDLVGPDAVLPQGFAQGVSHGADDAVLDESVALTAVAAGDVRAVGRQVVVEGGDVKQGLQGRVEVAGVAHVHHASAGRTGLAVADDDAGRREEYDLKRKDVKMSKSC